MQSEVHASGFPPVEELPDPATVIVELTNVCDLECPFCTTFQGMQRPKGFMSFGVFRRLIEELANWRPQPRISMNMAGEPLLHREVCRFVDFAAERGLYTFISTNATRLSAEAGERLIRAGLSAIYLCVDGASRKSHEAYRVGSSFEAVRSNCEQFLATRQRLDKDNPFVTIQTLLTAYSEVEIDAVVNWAQAAGADEVFFKSLSQGSNTPPDQLQTGLHLFPQREEFRRKTSGPIMRSCHYPREHTIVYWNGDVGVCCVDFNNMASLPGIGERGLAATLADPAVQAARQGGIARQHSLCQHCASADADFRGFRVDLRQRRTPREAGTDATR
jgi:MoaA/NifB/PqqE/SkfB family radical SAM enzyme